MENEKSFSSVIENSGEIMGYKIYIQVCICPRPPSGRSSVKSARDAAPTTRSTASAKVKEAAARQRRGDGGQVEKTWNFWEIFCFYKEIMNFYREICF